MTESNRFEVQPQFMKLLKRVYKTKLQEIEENFSVKIVWDGNTTTVRIDPTKNKNRFEEGCDAILDLYQKYAVEIGREEVELLDGADEARIVKVVSLAEAEDPVIIEKVDKNLVVFAEKNIIRRSVQSLKEKLGFTKDGSRKKTKRGQGNKRRDTCDENKMSQLSQFSSRQRLNQVLGNGVKLSLYEGDITDEPVDAIVNAANERLQHESGVAAAIVRKGGRQIQDESNLITSDEPLDVGQAVYTRGGNLPCRYVIHIVGPVWEEHGKGRSMAILFRAFVESFGLAAVKLKLSSIAFTTISPGIFGVPNNLCAQVMFNAVEEFSLSDFAESSSLCDVRIVINDTPTFWVFREEFVKRYSSQQVLSVTVTSQRNPSDVGEGSPRRTNTDAARKPPTTKLNSFQGMELQMPVREDNELIPDRRAPIQRKESRPYGLPQVGRSQDDEMHLCNATAHVLRTKEIISESGLQRTLGEERQARTAVDGQAKDAYAELKEPLQNQQLLHQSLQQIHAKENVIKEQQRHSEQERQQNTALEEASRNWKHRMDEELRGAIIANNELEERLQNERLSYQALQRELQEKENGIREQQQRLEQEHQQKTALEERLKNLEHRMNEELNEVRIANSELKERLQNEQLSYQFRQENENTIREQQGRLEKEYQQKKALEERMRSLEQRIEEERNSHLSTERELQTAVSAENQQKTALEERIRSLEEQMAEERNSHLSTERELRSAVSAENQQKTALEERVRSLEEQMEEEKSNHSSEERELQSALSAANRLLETENQQKAALEERLRRLEHRMEEERNSHLSTERELRSAVSAADHRLQEKNQQKTALEEGLRRLEQRMEEERNSHLSTERELQSAVSAAENALVEYQRHESRDWIIQRKEVALNVEKIVGEGAWGNVCEGTFRGCLVAVKKIHRLILSGYNRRLFEREMSIASRCRHPNLLQFIGATNDEGSPLFVAELLDTSLRNVLHQRALNHGEIVTLSLDVAKGLNYLHLSTPLPIMHRDISSANVLLWRRDESWRAKLSDYGAANFLRQSMTVNAGAIIYSAPEAFTPRQSTKFETVEDLKLLAKKKHKFLEAIKIPVCWQIKFEATIQSLEEG